MAVIYSPRDIAMHVRSALEFQEQYAAGKNPNDPSLLQDRLARTIPGELIPALKQVYKDLLGISAEWQQKAFQAALKDAAENGTLLAGFPAEVWIIWGELFLSVLQMLNTPHPTLGVTPIDVLLDDYIPSKVQILPPTPEPEPEPAPAPEPIPPEEPTPEP